MPAPTIGKPVRLPRYARRGVRLVLLIESLAIAVVADQDLHLGPRPVVSREEHDLVEEGVDVSLAGLTGDFRGDLGILVSEMVFQRAAQLLDERGTR